MSRMMKKLMVDESGATAVEYSLVAALFSFATLVTLTAASLID